jgi:hypothetical protein
LHESAAQKLHTFETTAKGEQKSHCHIRDSKLPSQKTTASCCTTTQNSNPYTSGNARTNAQRGGAAAKATTHACANGLRAASSYPAGLVAAPLHLENATPTHTHYLLPSDPIG